jgi:phospholipid/cholesterol/gamma-HCH transport system substrate-binding protein
VETKVNYAVVGAFVLLLGAALIGGVLWLASGGAYQKRYALYRAIEQESVAGLNVNAPVKYHGVEVGMVRAIQLDPANPEHVRLTLAIEPGTPIRQDTVAVLKTQGLTGIAYVELSGGSPEAARITESLKEPYPEIRTKPSLGTRLENVLTTVLAKLDRTTSNVDAVLSNENRAALESALTDIAAVAHTIAARQRTIDAAITNAASALATTERAAAQLGPAVERIGRGAQAVETMVDQVAALSGRAGVVVEAAGTDLQRLGTQTLPDLQRLLGELSVLSASLRRLSEQTERNPASLVLGRPPRPVGPGESAAPVLSP